MISRLTLVLFIALLTPSASAADQYTIDPNHTYPSFEIDHMGYSTTRGRFNSVQGKLSLDRDAKTGSVEVIIDAASIDTGLAKLEDVLRSADYFDVKRHPTLNFRGNQFRFDDSRLSAVEGELTLLGVTHPVTLVVTRFKCGLNLLRLRQACGADASATIKRSDFGLSKGLPLVGDEVKILIQIEAVKD
ncbi:MAG: polyisoprenoid-binding protein [Burkholderiales bacterium]|nr:polyisoprenoid-binding protein [Burkholderiales bacterium]